MAPTKKRTQKQNSVASGSSPKRLRPVDDDYVILNGIVPSPPDTHTENDNLGDNGMATWDFTTPKRLFQSLIAPTKFEEFFNDYWEKKPLVVHRNYGANASKQLREQVFGKAMLESVLKKHTMQLELDANVCRYVNGKKETLSTEGRLTAPRFNKYFNKESATVQFHQPQRFSELLWHIMEHMESFFGALVGSNIYMTPAGSQGFGAHYDDVEVFILQLEGEKHWKLYHPHVELPREGTENLQKEIGQPTHEFLLKPGDLLYFPRGVIHHAWTPEGDSHSTHITISTYQKHCWGDYLQSVFPLLIDEALKTDPDFRRGLPVNFIKSTKLAKTDKVQSVVGLLLQRLVKLRSKKFIAPTSMIQDFMSSRLPPFQVDGNSLQDTIPSGNPPDLLSKVRLKHPDHVCAIVHPNVPLPQGEEEDEESDSDEEVEGATGGDESTVTTHDTTHNFLSQSLLSQEEGECLFVYSSLFNDRTTHMMRPAGESGYVLKFPKSYVDALEQLKSHCDQFLPVSDLLLEMDDDRENLIRALWSSHLLEVIPGRKETGARKSMKLD